MKRTILMAIFAIALAATAVAQDFASKFMEGRKDDPNIMYMQLPKALINQALAQKKAGAKVAEAVKAVKEMSIAVAEANTDKYAEAAKQLAEANSKQLTKYLAIKKDKQDIAVYTKAGQGDNISELIAIVADDGQFALIDLTGDFTAEMLKNFADSSDGLSFGLPM